MSNIIVIIFNVIHRCLLRGCAAAVSLIHLMFQIIDP